METLNSLGYLITISEPSPVKSWGAWWVKIVKQGGPHICGYGVSEQEALEKAFKRAQELL